MDYTSVYDSWIKEYSVQFSWNKEGIAYGNISSMFLLRWISKTSVGYGSNIIKVTWWLHHICALFVRVCNAEKNCYNWSSRTSYCKKIKLVHFFMITVHFIITYRLISNKCLCMPKVLYLNIFMSQLNRYTISVIYDLQNH